MERGTPDNSLPWNGARHGAIAVAIVAGGLLLRGWLATRVFVFEVETYHWLWSRELAWGYYDHPPLVALVMSLSPLLGDSALGLRLGHILLSTAGSVVFCALCRRWLAPRAALISLAALQLAPFWLPFGVAANPDGPLLAYGCLALLTFQSASDRGGAVRWLGAGAATGLAILSKYNGALLLPSFFVFLLLDARGRRLLRSPGPWLAVAVTLALVLPNQLWNASHGSDANLRPFKDGLELARAAQNLAGLAALPFLGLTPLVAWAWLRQSWLGLRSRRLTDAPGFRLAFCASWLPLAVFAGVALVTEVHAHWIVPCLVTALPLALENLGRAAPGVSPRFLRVALATGAVIVVAVLATMLVAPAVARHEGTRRPRGPAQLAVESRGWSELALRIDREVAARGTPDRVFLTAAGHPLASRLEYVARGRLTSHALDPGRANQYAIWRRDRELLGWDALYVDKPHGGSDLPLLELACGSVEPLEPVRIAVGGEPFDRFDLAWCHDFRGVPHGALPR